jgi:hypothetical protein
MRWHHLKQTWMLLFYTINTSFNRQTSYLFQPTTLKHTNTILSKLKLRNQDLILVYLLHSVIFHCRAFELHFQSMISTHFPLWIYGVYHTHTHLYILCVNMPVWLRVYLGGGVRTRTRTYTQNHLLPSLLICLLLLSLVVSPYSC